MTTTTQLPAQDSTAEKTPVESRPGLARLMLQSTPQALQRLHPRTMARNPVMFVVLVGTVAATIFGVLQPSVFSISIVVWLWLTLIFANLAEAVAEGRGKAQAAHLRAAKQTTTAHRVEEGELVEVPSSELRKGDVVVITAGELIPGDGDVIEGVASVDESAITGESAPVIRESGGDRSAVTGGTRVLSDRIVVRITQEPGQSFLDRMIALVEGAERKKTPNEIALGILLSALTLVFVLAVSTLQPFAIHSGQGISAVVLIALLVCLIPTTIGALLSAIGIAGMDRLVQRNVLAMSGRAVEAAGDCSALLLDKTGTVTYGNRQADELLPVGEVLEMELSRAALLASLADETPEGRSIVTYVQLHEAEISDRWEAQAADGDVVPFSAETRMSGVDLANGEQIRKGAPSACFAWVEELGGSLSMNADQLVKQVSHSGGTPLVVAARPADGVPRILGIIHLKDVVKPGIRERFEQLRAMGIRTIMITGDNPVTAAAIAKEAGVDDFLAEAKPDDKVALIKREQAKGALVAMAGDGTNDAPALAAADVGVAMNTGTMAAKEAGNMVDLDSDPTKLIEVVQIGKQLLMTRGALTTFSIANDVAKYFAIIPALFIGLFPQLEALNIMRLHSPNSAILSAVIFNALIIVALVPLALKGVRQRALSAGQLLRRNLIIYGLGGVIAPFIGIKLIDLIVSLIPGM